MNIRRRFDGSFSSKTPRKIGWPALYACGKMSSDLIVKN
jgi:hypothetical protein